MEKLSRSRGSGRFAASRPLEYPQRQITSRQTSINADGLSHAPVCHRILSEQVALRCVAWNAATRRANGGGVPGRVARGQPGRRTGGPREYVTVIVDVATGKTIQTLANRAIQPSSLACSPDGKTIAVTANGVQLWNATEGTAGLKLPQGIGKPTRNASGPTARPWRRRQSILRAS